MFSLENKKSAESNSGQRPLSGWAKVRYHFRTMSIANKFLNNIDKSSEKIIEPPENTTFKPIFEDETGDKVSISQFSIAPSIPRF